MAWIWCTKKDIPNVEQHKLDAPKFLEKQIAPNMIKVPLSIEFSWPLPNYVNPATRGTTIVVVSSICMFIMIVIVFSILQVKLITFDEIIASMMSL